MRTQHGEWRLTAPMYKLLLTAHIVASVGWLGIVVAKLALTVAAVRTIDPGVAHALFVAISVIDRVFPPAAILTLVSGVVLGLVTRWGIVQFTWVLVKLVLTIAVPATAVRIGDRLLQNSLSGSSVESTTVLRLDSAPMALLWLAGAHVLMLGAATVLSVYKPWGKSWFGKRSERKTVSRTVVRA